MSRRGRGEIIYALHFVHLPSHNTQQAMQMSLHTTSAPPMSLCYFNNAVDSFLQHPVLGWLCAWGLGFPDIWPGTCLFLLVTLRLRKATHWARQKHVGVHPQHRKIAAISEKSMEKSTFCENDILWGLIREQIPCLCPPEQNWSLQQSFLSQNMEIIAS